MLYAIIENEEDEKKTTTVSKKFRLEEVEEEHMKKIRKLRNMRSIGNHQNTLLLSFQRIYYEVS